MDSLTHHQSLDPGRARRACLYLVAAVAFIVGLSGACPKCVSGAASWGAHQPAVFVQRSANSSRGSGGLAATERWWHAETDADPTDATASGGDDADADAGEEPTASPTARAKRPQRPRRSRTASRSPVPPAPTEAEPRQREKAQGKGEEGAPSPSPSPAPSGVAAADAALLRARRRITDHMFNLRVRGGVAAAGISFPDLRRCMLGSWPVVTRAAAAADDDGDSGNHTSAVECVLAALEARHPSDDDNSLCYRHLPFSGGLVDMLRHFRQLSHARRAKKMDKYGNSKQLRRRLLRGSSSSSRELAPRGGGGGSGGKGGRRKAPTKRYMQVLRVFNDNRFNGFGDHVRGFVTAIGVALLSVRPKLMVIDSFEGRSRVNIPLTVGWTPCPHPKSYNWTVPPQWYPALRKGSYLDHKGRARMSEHDPKQPNAHNARVDHNGGWKAQHLVVFPRNIHDADLRQSVLRRMASGQTLAPLVTFIGNIVEPDWRLNASMPWDAAAWYRADTADRAWPAPHWRGVDAENATAGGGFPCNGLPPEMAGVLYGEEVGYACARKAAAAVAAAPPAAAGGGGREDEDDEGADGDASGDGDATASAAAEGDGADESSDNSSSGDSGGDGGSETQRAMAVRRRLMDGDELTAGEGVDGDDDDGPNGYSIYPPARYGAGNVNLFMQLLDYFFWPSAGMLTRINARVLRYYRPGRQYVIAIHMRIGTPAKGAGYHDFDRDDIHSAVPLAYRCAGLAMQRLVDAFGPRDEFLWYVASDRPDALALLRKRVDTLGPPRVTVDAAVAASVAAAAAAGNTSALAAGGGVSVPPRLRIIDLGLTRVVHTGAKHFASDAVVAGYVDAYTEHFLLSAAHATVRSKSGFSSTAQAWGRQPVAYRFVSGRSKDLPPNDDRRCVDMSFSYKNL
jgi:hypothetical protein